MDLIMLLSSELICAWCGGEMEAFLGEASDDA
jgi:hypothetical protein